MATTIQKLATTVTLTGSAVDSTNTSMTEGMCAHTLDFEYTPGASGNVLTVTIFHRNKGSTDGAYTQEMQWNDSPAGTYVRTLNQLQFTATGTSLVPLSFFFQGHYGEVKIQYTESGSVFGTISAMLTSSTQS